MAPAKPFKFEALAQRARRAGIDTQDVRASREWYFKTVKDIQKVTIDGKNTRLTPERILASKDLIDVTAISTLMIGAMAAFFYDPRFKQTLPYYDKFPLIFVAGMAPGGFYGINMHYLAPPQRAQLMEALYSFTNKTRVPDEKTRLAISYSLLNRAARTKLFRPCFKHYLTSHVASKIKLIPAQHWDQALMLPTQRFMKASASAVWKFSSEEA
jgi:hypothetical protein